MNAEAPSRVATREDVEKIVNEVYADWLAGNGAEKVTCAYDINSGPCCDFANDVAALVEERFPGTEVEVEDYEDYLALDGLTANGIHYYVKCAGWYFDAARPEGEPSPDYLPTCREIRRYASPVDGDEDIDEDLADDDDDGEDLSYDSLLPNLRQG
jgi:hypothetical protein